VTRAARITAFVSGIAEWYAMHRRDLPWRRDLSTVDDTARAYRVLVSEIMLQQTQVSRVAVIYPRFLREFPSLGALARASNRDVLLAWRGMGYNRRALALRDCAADIVRASSERLWRAGCANDAVDFPVEMQDLLSLKGIGPYTAAAIRNFAFNLPTPCLDTNIRRILHRTFVGPERADGTFAKDDRYLLSLAAEVLEEAMAGPFLLPGTAEWHAALMDFGSIVCTKTDPKWDECPLTEKGIMKAAHRVRPMHRVRAASAEPGRMIGARFVPNRITRGRVVDALREAADGLTLNRIGARVSGDWSFSLHRKWLGDILSVLEKEGMVAGRRNKFVLAE